MKQAAWNPQRLLELSGSYWETFALHAAVKLGLFDELGSEQLSAEEAAGRMGADARGLGVLMDAMAAMNLLEKTNGRYRNSEAALTYLCKHAPAYVGFMIMHHHHLVPSWARLDEAVKTGRPVRSRSIFSDAEQRESFLMGMFNNAMTLAPKIAEALDLSDRRHLLDMGGGPGTYAVHFCLRNPQLRATVFDLPGTQPFALKIIARFGLTERIHFAAGDFLVDALPGTYDAVWISHILHAEGPEACRRIIGKAASVLHSGGLLFVQDFILNDAKDGPLFPALFALNMLSGTESGRSYSEAEIGAMLAGAGLHRIRRLPFSGPTGSGILQAEAP